MNSGIWISVSMLAVFSMLMVLALVPFSIGWVAGSEKWASHRKRLKRLGPPGVLTERLLPAGLQRWSTVQVWTALYLLTWLGILAAITGLLLSSGEPLAARAFAPGAFVILGFWAVHGLLIWFGRALEAGKHRAAGSRDAGAAAPFEEAGARSAGSSISEPQMQAAVASDESVPAARETPLQKILWQCLWLGIVGAAVVLGQTPAVQALEHLIAPHRTILLGLTISVTVIGVLMFASGLFSTLLHRGVQMSHEEVESLYRRNEDSQAMPYRWRKSKYWIGGRTSGLQAEDSFSFREAKAAWRARAWRESPVWKRRMITSIGGLLALVGGFCIAFVVTPPFVKLLVAGALLYAVFRLIHSFSRA